LVPRLNEVQVKQKNKKKRIEVRDGRSDHITGGGGKGIEKYAGESAGG